MINEILVKFISNFSSKIRKIILIILDLFMIIISNELVIWLLPESSIYYDSNLFFKPFLIFISLSIYIFTGQYRSLSRYIGSRNIYIISLRNFTIIILLILLNSNFLNLTISLKYYILLWVLSTIFIGTSKFIFRDILLSGSISKLRKNNVVMIYGAGRLGAQLASILKLEGFIIEAFIDDDKNKWDRVLYGTKIISVNQLEKYVRNINQIYISIPNLSKVKKRIVYNLSLKNKIKVLDIDLKDDLTSGNLKRETFKIIEIEKILGRDVVKPYKEFLGPGIKNKNICITGAGGSIGSEIARKCLEQNPNKLVLIDNSETNLFHINEEITGNLKNKSSNNISISPCLVNVIDQSFLEKIFLREQVEIVFHAAAYKHVPLVEINPLQGIKNNFLSVQSVCRASIKANVKQALFISSDKAVRPTNIMGATKRLSEIIVKIYSLDYLDKKHNTIFSSVRFGNVIGSSGSVVPKFKKQIANGGPLTITHEEVVRYFMTIEEASQLVLQAAFLAKGGEIFLLDMGKPLKIIDLAKQIIFLSGYTVKEKDNPNGDIEIIKIGLRPGEKLFEELLISGESLPTAHPLIYIEKEVNQILERALLKKKLAQLESVIKQNNQEKTLDLLFELVPEWQRKNK